MSAKFPLTTVVFLAVTTPLSLQATYPGANGLIAYSHVEGPYNYGNEYHMIRAINPDGTGEHDILDKYYKFTWMGSWSPDGKKFVYERGDLYPHELWQANADGSSPKKITTATCTVANPDWSPDGNRIVFQDCVDGNVEIYIADIDGSNRKRITNSPSWEGEAVWSPDGKRLAYTRDGRIWVMNSDGSNAINLAKGIRPNWSPDGSKIAFNDIGISIMDSDGSNIKNIASHGDFPKWSPDGTKIVFDDDKGYGGLRLGIYVMNSDGGNNHLYLFNEQMKHP